MNETPALPSTPPPLWWQLKQFCEAFDDGHGYSENCPVCWNVIMWKQLNDDEKAFVQQHHEKIYEVIQIYSGEAGIEEEINHMLINRVYDVENLKSDYMLCSIDKMDLRSINQISINDFSSYLKNGLSFHNQIIPFVLSIYKAKNFRILPKIEFSKCVITNFFTINESNITFSFDDNKICNYFGIKINNCIIDYISLKDNFFLNTLSFNFTNSIFKQNANFSNVTFTGDVCFDGVTFEGEAHFNEAVFHRHATFKSAIFKKSASFKGATFLCHELAEAHHRQGTLSPSFISATFHEVANFKKSRFDAPPHFEGAKVEVLLLEGSSFNNCTFKKDKDGTEILDEHGNPIPMTKGLDLAASAWAALIIITEKLHNLPQRQKFHHRLLEVEQDMIATADTLKHERHHLAFYHIYDTLGKGSDVKPPMLLFMSICLNYAILCFGLLSSDYGINEWGNIMLKSWKLVIYDAIPLLKFSKTEVDNIVKTISEITNGHWFLELSFLLFRGFVSLASPLCLFMIGLALRNRFRIKS